MKKGYTIIELMITLSIVAVLVGFGLSAYSSARDRQIGQAAGDTLVNLITAGQQDAKIGKKDCTGTFIGIEMTTTTGTNHLTTQSLCQGDAGVKISTALDGITFTNTTDFTFLPLSGGVRLGQGSPLAINYTSSGGIKYYISITDTGIIRYRGVLP